MSLPRLLLLLLPCVRLLAQQEPDGFAPPAAYPLDRYEAGWNKNPFTLKTAPVVAATASFAADLAIGSFYGAEEDPTVVIVNTKTNQRIPLKKGVVHSSGMKLNSISYGSSRKDVAADVTLGPETATLHFNDSYSKQVASAESARAPAALPQGQQPRQLPNGNPAAQNQRPLVPVPPLPTQGAAGNPPGVPAMQGASGSQPPFPQPALSTGQQPRNVPQTGAQPSPAGQPSTPPPATPSRIRVLAPVTNPSAINQ